MKKENIKKVFTGKVAREWDSKAELISCVKGNDNIVYPELEKEGFNGMQFLDVGCATGRLLSKVSEKFQKCEFTGIDISEEMIRYAKKREYTNKNKLLLINADFMEYDFLDNMYDFIVFKFVLHHMVDEKGALEKANKLLKKGGVLLLYIPGKAHFQEMFDDISEGEDILGRKNAEQIKDLMCECGMDKIEIVPALFKMNIRTFDKFIEFLKRIGSYQKIVEYQDVNWSQEFLDKVKSRFQQDMWHNGEYLMVLYTK